MASISSRVLCALLITGVLGHSALAGTIEGRVVRSEPTAELSNFVIFLDDIERAYSSPPEPAVMDQKELQFVPHTLVVQVGTDVEFPNSDPVLHNVFSISEAKRFNLGLYKRGVNRRVKFDKPGVVEVLCNVHLEMSAYIIVVKNPFFAKTGPDGAFRISGVPGGRHRLRCWHEGLPIQELEIEVPTDGTVKVTFHIRS